MTSDLAARFLQGLGDAPQPLGLAVSGGGDSMALLHLAVQAGLRCHAVTVDHGLRPEAATEAAVVAGACAALGVAHDSLCWQGWDGHGNLQDQARRARYRLMADWAAHRGLAAVALGHTRDDQAETFLMRLARGAGVDGLAAMSSRRQWLGVDWRRPLLGVGRDALRDWLRARGVTWVDDPSNDDVHYDRVRVRQALGGLAGLGIDAARLAAVAGHLAQVRDALDVQVLAAARQFAHVEAGDVVLDAAALTELPPEIARRLLRQALVWVASAEYGPRGAALARLTDALQAARPATLLGCRLLPRRGAVRVTREWQAVRDLTCPSDALWDGRWRMIGPQINGLQLRALGAEGLALCPAWRHTGRPRAALLASPSLWHQGELVAAPLAGRPAAWQAETVGGPDAFYLSILSH
ncbi:MAG: tRNA lysidine(34) synthetase TilS [Pseudorhodobacter sp.]|nr:tRNA lysidine(34) synthetase TilS [Pseudorhodobacter sp.]